ncbi:MAG: ligase-associated DNA damage response exonuclease [Phaeodactylibacter sp.]|nr:ligase-associated DNA damage response exonuclease [Phaeodactylibacter sp.]MCB9299733.1 ligase-associated DNA damage response exonuclease [Lewinellaceae bacterium]
MALLEFSEKGIFCPAAGIHIDPWRPVERALITHGHADHSRWGHRSYLCTESAKPVIRYRLGDVNIQTIKYGEQLSINGVNFSFHPAGHILGSAQIRVEHKGEVWVVSGDYKLENDGLSEPFEPVRCQTFITESTFGLPVYRWKKQEEVFREINDWWQNNKAEGKVSVLTAYALGKAQRLLQGLDSTIGPIYTHGAIESTNQVIRKQGIRLPKTQRASANVLKRDYIGSMVIAPPSALGSPWMHKFTPASIGIASGWMALRGARRRRAADRGFVLSDHADWDGLNDAITATGAERIIVTHGYTSIFRKYLEEVRGLEAYETQTEFEGERSEIGETNNEGESEELNG